MRIRCLYPSQPSYPRYGGRGIRFAEEWNSFPAFLKWALASGWKPGLTLERIDNDGNYEPANCTWATRVQQGRNTSRNRMIEAFGETKTATDWAKDPRAAVGRRVITQRIDVNGFSPERAITAKPWAVIRGEDR